MSSNIENKVSSIKNKIILMDLGCLLLNIVCKK